MNSELYNILCENNLGFPQIVVALTSRGIHTLADFLEKGEDALKDMHDKWEVHGQSWKTTQDRVNGYNEFKLILPVQRNKLTRVLETLRDTKK